jgi:hypothetical protein
MGCIDDPLSAVPPLATREQLAACHRHPIENMQLRSHHSGDGRCQSQKNKTSQDGVLPIPMNDDGHVYLHRVCVVCVVCMVVVTAD